MARLPINCCWRPIDGGEKPDLLASQLLEFIAIDTCSGRCLMAKIRVIRKATRSFRLGQMLFKTRTREIESRKVDRLDQGSWHRAAVARSGLSAVRHGSKWPAQQIKMAIHT